MSVVQDFYRNQVMRDQVRAYIEQQFEKEAVEKVFKREDVSHIADAKELLDKSFTAMEVEFAAKKENKSINNQR